MPFSNINIRVILIMGVSFMEYSGIDVSQWQGHIDWEDVSKDNIDFAMIRSSYGSSGIDNQFVNNITNIAKTNIHPGAYHYTYALSKSSANIEANHFLNVISPYKFTYPVTLDIEDDSLYPLGAQTVTDIALEFCSVVEKAGYYVNIYSSLNFINNYLDISRLSQFDLWLAQWASKPTYSGDFGLWQYSSTGSVKGVSGNIDLNKSFKDYPSIITGLGLNKASPDAKPGVPTVPTTINYTVVSGDTLWSISKKFLGDGSKYVLIKAANGLSNDIIHPAQILVIPSVSEGDIPTAYTVVSGDTLWSIAERFLRDGSKYTKIKSANGLSNDTIYKGQALIIPPSPSGDVPTRYTVVSGDTLWSIAERFLKSGSKYTEIKGANGLSNDIIYPGQVLVIP